MADKKISALTASSTPLAGTEVLPIVQSGSTVKVSVDNLTAGRTVSTGIVTSTATTGSQAIYTGWSPTGGAHPANGSADFGISAGNKGIVSYDSTGSFPGALYLENTYNDNSASIRFRTRNVDRFIVQGNGDLTAASGNLVLGTAGKGIDFSANTHAAGMTSELLDWYEEGTWTGTLTAATPPTTPITKTGRYTRIGNQITIAIEFDNVDTSGASGAMEVTGLPFAATAAGYGPVMKSGIGTQVIMAGIYGGLSKVIFSDAGTMSTTSIVAGAGVYLRFSATYYV